MRRLLSIIISLITVMAFAQQPVESTSNESDPMLRIGKSYLGTRYVANTLDRNEVEQLVINTKEVDCLTFVEYTLAQALGSSLPITCKGYVTGTVSSMDTPPACIILPTGLIMVSATVF